MNIEEFCKFLGITKPTIYNWKKDKPNLYKIVMEYKEKKLNNFTNNEEEIVKLFNQLTNKQKEMYIFEIKARIIRNEIEN